MEFLSDMGCCCWAEGIFYWNVDGMDEGFGEVVGERGTGQDVQFTVEARPAVAFYRWGFVWGRLFGGG